MMNEPRKRAYCTCGDTPDMTDAEYIGKLEEEYAKLRQRLRVQQAVTDSQEKIIAAQTEMIEIMKRMHEREEQR